MTTRQPVKRNIAVLGATGSIGSSALDVIARHPETLRASILAAGHNVDELVKLCRAHQPTHAVIADGQRYVELRDALAQSGLRVTAHAGTEALNALVSSDACDTVVAAIVGAAGLPSTLAAAQSGKRLLLANKESLVLAGALVMAAAQASGAEIIPVDSEHNAIFQCLGSREANAQVRRIVLTASGGPFRGCSKASLKTVTVAQAVAHPRWSMGPKISVDSATLMNKGLELIEAAHLFGVSRERLDVVVHPQSLVHSLVDFIDGSTLAQLGLPDMRTALSVGFGWPERLESGVGMLDLMRHGTLEFEAPDMEAFPCLRLAWEALDIGGAAPAVLNAANEFAVSAFLQGKIDFLTISALVEDTLVAHAHASSENLDALLEADAQARCFAQKWVDQTHIGKTRTA